MNFGRSSGKKYMRFQHWVNFQTLGENRALGELWGLEFLAHRKQVDLRKRIEHRTQHFRFFNDRASPRFSTCAEHNTHLIGGVFLQQNFKNLQNVPSDSSKTKISKTHRLGVKFCLLDRGLLNLTALLPDVFSETDAACIVELSSNAAGKSILFSICATSSK
jgi:hypothetical protein